jgi:hypothetical protein
MRGLPVVLSVVGLAAACGRPEVLVNSENARVVSTLEEESGVSGFILEAEDPTRPLGATIATSGESTLVFSTDGLARLSDAQWSVSGRRNDPQTTYQLDGPGDSEYRVSLDPDGSGSRRLTVLLSNGACDGCAQFVVPAAWLVAAGVAVSTALIVKVYYAINCPNVGRSSTRE